MKPSRSSPQPPGRTEIEMALQAVRDDGGRSTMTRRIVLEALRREDPDGVTAEDLAGRIRTEYPTFNSSTIYRCLERFEQLGITTHVHLGHGPALWRLADRPRWYLVCTSCGGTTSADPALIERLGAAVLDQTGFAMDGHFAITGRCVACSARSARPGGGTPAASAS